MPSGGSDDGCSKTTSLSLSILINSGTLLDPSEAARASMMLDRLSKEATPSRYLQYPFRYSKPVSALEMHFGSFIEDYRQAASNSLVRAYLIDHIYA